MIFRARHSIWLLALALLAMAVGGFAQSVTLVWSASPSPNIAGYWIYYGTNSRSYAFVTNAGPRLTQTVALPWSGRWYFTATAYDTNLIESLYSNEVEWEPRPAPPIVQGENIVRVVPVIERSTNQVNWSAEMGEPTYFAATNAVEFFRSQLVIERVVQLR